MGLPKNCQRDSSKVAWFFCGQETQENLDGSSPLSFLD